MKFEKLEQYVSPFDVCDHPVRVTITQSFQSHWNLELVLSGGWFVTNLPVESLAEAQLILDRWLPLSADGHRRSSISASDLSTQYARWSAGRQGWRTRRAAA